jgi:hypothetical protein
MVAADVGADETLNVQRSTLNSQSSELAPTFFER